MYARADVLRRFDALFIVEYAKHFSTAAGVASNPLAEKTAPQAVFLCLRFGTANGYGIRRAGRTKHSLCRRRTARCGQGYHAKNQKLGADRQPSASMVVNPLDACMLPVPEKFLSPIHL